MHSQKKRHNTTQHNTTGTTRLSAAWTDRNRTSCRRQHRTNKKNKSIRYKCLEWTNFQLSYTLCGVLVHRIRLHNNFGKKDQYDRQIVFRSAPFSWSIRDYLSKSSRFTLASGCLYKVESRCVGDQRRHSHSHQMNDRGKLRCSKNKT